MNELAKRNGNEPANPCSDRYDGLTKRELFAAMAMQGLMSDSDYVGDLEDACAASVRIADKLLEELNK